MLGDNGDDDAVRPPSRRELRAARQRAHEIEKERRAKQSSGKGDKKGKGRQQPGGGGDRR